MSAEAQLIEGGSAPSVRTQAFGSVLRSTPSIVELLLLTLCVTAAFPLYANPVGSFTLRSPDLLTLLAGGFWLAHFATGRATPLRRTALDLPLLVLAGALLASFAVAQDVALWAKAVRPWAFAISFFYLLAAHVNTLAQARLVLRLAWVGLCGQAVMGVLQLVLGRPFMRDFLGGWGGFFLYESDVVEQRYPDFYFNWAVPLNDPLQSVGISVLPSGTCINNTNFGSLMACLAVVGLFGWSSGRRSGRWAVAASFVATILLALSFKRSGWLALLAALPFLLALRNRVSTLKVALVVAGVAVALAAGGIAKPKFGQRLIERGESLATELQREKLPEPNSRLRLWTHAWGVFREHPLTGVGAGQWTLHGPWTPTRRGLIRWGNTESSLISLAVETGLPGALGYLGLLAVLFWLALRTVVRRGEAAPLAAGAAAGLFALATGGMLNSFLMDDHVWPLFFSLAIVILVADRVDRSAAPPA